jgi:hypothetical protein
MITMHIGNSEGFPVYAHIPDEEYDELLKQGFTHSEINSLYQLRDWQCDC